MMMELKDGWFITPYCCPDCGARMVSKIEDIMFIEVWDEYPTYCSKCGKESTIQEGEKMVRRMDERTVADLPDGKARSHAISRMEDAYVKIQKTYNIMGSGFGKMTQEDLDKVCTLLYESYNLMVHARRDFTYGFKEE